MQNSSCFHARPHLVIGYKHLNDTVFKLILVLRIFSFIRRQADLLGWII